VDDLFTFSTNDKLRDELEEALRKRYKMTGGALLTWALGMRFVQDLENGVTTIDQESYVLALLEDYGMHDCNSAPTPATPSRSLTKPGPVPDDEKAEYADHHRRYQQLIGSLGWLQSNCYPEISEAVRELRKYNHHSGKEQWTAAKRVLRYLKGASTFGIRFTKASDMKMECYADSNWAADKDNRRSVSGVFTRFCGGPVWWKSSGQKSVALSTTEAELMAACEGAKEISWERSFLNELGLELKEPTTLFEDNKGCIHLSKHDTFSGATKHIDLRYHYLNECIEDGKINVQHLSTIEMIADVLTKPLPSARFKKLARRLCGYEH